MDCRWALVLAAGLCAGAVGCVHTDPEHKWAGDPAYKSSDNESALSGSSDSSDPPLDKNRKKRKPKPATCVAMGKLRDQAADDPSCPPSEQPKMREEAQLFYEQALKIDPKCLAAYQALGNLFDKMGNYDRTVETYQKAISIYPKDAELYSGLGMCQLRHKEWDAGLVNLRKAAELEPKNPKYARALGFSLARVGRFDESYACLKNAVGEALAHYYLARMMHHLQLNAESLEHAQLALQADPKMQPAQKLLDELQGRIPAPPAGAVVPAGFEQ